MNKFQIIAAMQQSVRPMNDNSWQLSAQGRTVAFIIKAEPGVYRCSITMTEHKTFMSALAAALPAWTETTERILRQMDYVPEHKAQKAERRFIVVNGNVQFI